MEGQGQREREQEGGAEEGGKHGEICQIWWKTGLGVSPSAGTQKKCLTFIGGVTGTVNPARRGSLEGW